MPRGVLPDEYWQNPHVRKPIEAIYSDIDSFSFETFEDETALYQNFYVFIVLPPVKYDGYFVKGILFTAAVDLLKKFHPDISDYFILIACHGWASYPWSQEADAYFTLYPNTHREEWFRRTHPEKADKILVPLETADWTHEYVHLPARFIKKDIDVLCVSRLHCGKNIPLIAEAIRLYREKHPEHPIRMALLTGKTFDANWNGLNEEEKEELRSLQSLLGHMRDYMDIVPNVYDFPTLLNYYSRAKVCVLGSLIEGKNRSIKEAMCCNTPVICFQEFNQYIRGNAPVFPEGAGLYATFNAESLADTLHTVLMNPQNFTPRIQYLKESGRRNFLRTCLHHIPYYHLALPDYADGAIQENIWLDLAIYSNYQLSLHDFIYDRKSDLSIAKGLEAFGRLFRVYQEQVQPL